MRCPVPKQGGTSRSSCPKEGDPEISLPLLVPLTSCLGAATWLFPRPCPHILRALWGCPTLLIPCPCGSQWPSPCQYTPAIPRLPSIRLERPRFVMTAACESPVRARQRFTVTYTLLNDLQDFLAVRLVWTPETATAGGDRGDGAWQGTGWVGGLEGLVVPLGVAKRGTDGVREGGQPGWDICSQEVLEVAGQGPAVPSPPRLWSLQGRSCPGRSGGPRRRRWMPSCATRRSTTWATRARAAPSPSVWLSRRCGLASSR